MKINYNYFVKQNITHIVCRKLFILVILTLLSVNSFSQSESNTKRTLVIELLKSNDGDVLFTQLLENTLKDVDMSKRTRYRNEVQTQATKIKNEAIVYFMDKYSQKEIEGFLEEFKIEDRIGRTDKFYQFQGEWKNYKRRFHKEFMNIYYTYKN